MMNRFMGSSYSSFVVTLLRELGSACRPNKILFQNWLQENHLNVMGGLA